MLMDMLVHSLEAGAAKDRENAHVQDPEIKLTEGGAKSADKDKEAACAACDTETFDLMLKIRD